jgi:hypothetical protein
MQKSIGYLTISLFLLSPRLVNAQSPAYEPQSNPSDTFIAPHFSRFVYIIAIAVAAVIGFVL